MKHINDDLQLQELALGYHIRRYSTNSTYCCTITVTADVISHDATDSASATPSISNFGQSMHESIMASSSDRTVAGVEYEVGLVSTEVADGLPCDGQGELCMLVDGTAGKVRTVLSALLLWSA